MSWPYTKRYYIQRPDLFVKNACSRIKWFYQRGKRGYSDSDTWGFDEYLLRVIPAAIRQIAVTSHGHPGTFCIEECCGFDKIVECTCDERFTSMLNEIADGLSEGLKINSYNHDYEYDKDKFGHAFTLFHEHFFEIND